MKIKVMIGLALAMIPVFFLTAQYRAANNRPADIRDAVADEMQSLENGMPAAPAGTVPEAGEPAPPTPEKTAKLSALGDLTLKMVSFKTKMARADLSLWEVSRIIENKEGGSIDNALSQLSADLRKCTAAAKEFNAQAGPALAKTRKTPDNLATAKLLLADIGEYTDNDETIALIRFGHLNTRYPAYKGKLQPQIEEYMKTLEALSAAGGKVVKFSGTLQSE